MATQRVLPNPLPIHVFPEDTCLEVKLLLGCPTTGDSRKAGVSVQWDVMQVIEGLGPLYRN